MSESVELKFPVVVHHRLIYDAARRDEAVMKATFAGFELEDRLERYAAVREGHKTVSEVFVKDLRARAAKLAKTMRNPFFAGVGRFTGLRQENMVLQRRQGYADIYVTWLMLKHTLDTTQTGLAVGHRPISALYEFWCFLRMADLLEKDFGFGRPEGMIDGAKVYDDLFEEPDPDKIDTKTLSALTYKFPEKDGVSIIGKKGLTLPYMFYCICLTGRYGRSGIRDTLRGGADNGGLTNGDATER